MTLSLPQASDKYDASNERQTRKALELAVSDLQTKLQTIQTSVGALSLGQSRITLANGANNNVSVGYASFIRIDGPSSSFSITGIAAGEMGRPLVIRNSTAQQMTIANQSASSTESNRIITGTGADLVLTGSTGQMVILVYDAVTLRWIVAAKHESSDT
jgi:hypothetical protein